MYDISRKTTHDSDLPFEGEGVQNIQNLPNGQRLKRSRMDGQPLEIKIKNWIDVFPEELWQMILDRVDDSMDIQNVLVAFPELGDIFHGKKPEWFIGLVFPHIFKQFYGFYNRKDIGSLLSIRAVCKRWCSVAESFLEHHPSRHLYNHNKTNRRHVSYGQFNYIQEGAQLLQLSGTEAIQRCHNKIIDHPRNPFIIGRLIISNHKLGKPHEPFLDASLLVLQKYGHYISHFEFYIEIASRGRLNDNEVDSIFTRIFECLSCTQNVRYLRISLIFDYETLRDRNEKMFNAKFAKQIPTFPRLDTLIIEDASYRENACLTNAFELAKQTRNVKSLTARLDTYLFTSRAMFPNMRELCLDISGYTDLIFEELNFLNKINCPRLRKLSFTSKEPTTISIFNLFIVLSKLEIVELSLLGNCTIEDCMKYKLWPISSIKYFRVGDGLTHGFQCLKMFPSLEYLHLHFQDTEHVGYWEIKEKMSSYKNKIGINSQVRKYMYEDVVPENVNIWEMLPKLKIITVEKYDTMRQYARECSNTPFEVKWDDKHEMYEDPDDVDSDIESDNGQMRNLDESDTSDYSNSGSSNCDEGSEQSSSSEEGSDDGENGMDIMW